MLTLFFAACTSADTDETETTPVDSEDTTTSAVDTNTDPDTAEGGLWTKYKVDTEASLRGVYSSGDGVYVIGTRGLAWVGSATEAWSPLVMPTQVTGVDLNALWGNSNGDTLELAVAADDGWVLTYSAGVWSAWSLGTDDNLGIDGSSINDLTVVGENGIQHFDGTAWTVQALPVGVMNAVWTYDGGAVAVGDEGEAMMRDSAGAWVSSDTGKAANFYGVAGTSASDVWAVGDQSVIMRYNGTSWKQTAVVPTDTLNAVFAPELTSVIVVGNNGTAMRWEGTRWLTMESDTNQNLYAVHGVSGANAWTVGNGGLAAQYKAN